MDSKCTNHWLIIWMLDRSLSLKLPVPPCSTALELYALYNVGDLTKCGAMHVVFLHDACIITVTSNTHYMLNCSSCDWLFGSMPAILCSNFHQSILSKIHNSIIHVQRLVTLVLRFIIYIVISLSGSANVLMLVPFGNHKASHSYMGHHHCCSASHLDMVCTAILKHSISGCKDASASTASANAAVYWSLCSMLRSMCQELFQDPRAKVENVDFH